MEATEKRGRGRPTSESSENTGRGIDLQIRNQQIASYAKVMVDAGTQILRLSGTQGEDLKVFTSFCDRMDRVPA